MKKYLMRVSCGLFAAALLSLYSAGTGYAKSNFYADDKAWKEYTAVQKASYVKGLYEGLTAEELIGNKRSKLLTRIPAYDPEELTKQLDDFYGDYNNEGIPVINALTIIEEINRGVSKGKLKKLTDDTKDANLNIDRLF